LTKLHGKILRTGANQRFTQAFFVLSKVFLAAFF